MKLADGTRRTVYGKKQGKLDRAKKLLDFS
jgi:hypothetical protein